MGWTKRQLLTAALAELGINTEFSVDADTLLACARSLDAMMAEWDGRGIRLGYPVVVSPDDTDLDVDTLCPLWSNTAIVKNLALEIAPQFGREPPGRLKQRAVQALNTVAAKMTQPPTMQYPSTLPVGAGNKPWRNTSTPFYQPSDPVLVGDDGDLVLE